MGESGPDSSDYSYDLDDQDYQQDLGYTDPDAMTNTSSDYTSSSEEEDYHQQPLKVPAAVRQLPGDIRQRPVRVPVPGVSYMDSAASSYTIDPGSRYSTDSDSHTRALLNDTAPPNYAPDRWPAYCDFLFVLSSFLAAVLAAYYTLA